MVFEIIQRNFVGVAINLFLILFILTNNNFEKRTNRLFLSAATCVLALIITETWEAQLALRSSYAAVRVPLSVIGYILRPTIAYLLVRMIQGNTGKSITLLTIPLIFNVVVCMTAFFSPVAFSYTLDNQFVRGPLGLTPFIVAGFYVIILLALNMRGFRNGWSMEAMIVSAIVMLAFISTVMESVFRFQSIQNASIGISITYYYLFLHSNRNNRDPLTGVLTRSRFYLDGEKHSSSLTAVISLDLNNLKTLNDQYGHEAGDRALVVTADTISKCLPRGAGGHAALYRIGGDEFMILCYRLSEDDVQVMISRIRMEMAKTEYSCAMGYAVFSQNMELDQACHLADKAMYENKRHMKGLVAQPL